MAQLLPTAPEPDKRAPEAEETAPAGAVPPSGKVLPLHRSQPAKPDTAQDIAAILSLFLG